MSWRTGDCRNQCLRSISLHGIYDVKLQAFGIVLLLALLTGFLDASYTWLASLKVIASTLLWLGRFARDHILAS